MLQRVGPLDKLVHEVALPGETRGDLVVPHHPNGVQLAQDRFLLLIGMMGFRSADDATSIVYQLRAEQWDGPILSEGFLSRTRNDWDPFNRGATWVRQMGHPMAIGVPRGAVTGGVPVAHDNVFYARWRVCAREFDPATGAVMLRGKDVAALGDHHWLARTQRVSGVHFRLRDDASDIELLDAEQPLRQVGFEDDDAGCGCALPLRMINIGFAQPQPVGPELTTWLDVGHGITHNGDRVVFVMRLDFDPASGRYRWTQTGPPIGREVEGGLFEGSLVRIGDRWVLAGRRGRGVGVAWAELDDPLGPPARVRVAQDVQSLGTPITAYACADGALRLFTGDGAVSPYGHEPRDWLMSRNPLYCWRIDPDDGFRATERHLVFDALARPARMTEDQLPVVDYGKVLPHLGGTRQWMLHRVRPSTMRSREPDAAARIGPRAVNLSDEAFASTGIYAASMRYAESHPPFWRFA